jgi:hypothetical protein
MENIPAWAQNVFDKCRRSGHPDFPDFEARIKGRWSEINSDVLPEFERLENNQKSELLQSLFVSGFHFRGNRVSEARSQLKQLIELNKDIARHAKKLASLLHRKQGILDQELVYEIPFHDSRWWDANLIVSGTRRACDQPTLEDILKGLASTLGYPVREEVFREKREEEEEEKKIEAESKKVWAQLSAKEKRKWNSLKKRAERNGEVIYEHEIIDWAALPEDRKRIWETFTENERTIWENMVEDGKIKFETLTPDIRNKWMAGCVASDAEIEARRRIAANYLERRERIIGHRHNHIALASREASSSDYIRIVLESLTVWDEEKAGREGVYFDLSNGAVATLAEVLFDLPSGSVTEENVRKIRRPFEPPSHPWNFR